MVLTSGHCLTNRPKPIGHVDVRHGCSDWQSPTRWYRFGLPVPVSLGRDSENWVFQTQARSYSLPGCMDIILVRLDTAVPAHVATPAAVITRPAQMPRGHAPLQIAGWGSSGLEDLWTRSAQTSNAPWGVIGHADGVNGMAQDGGFLYAATDRNALWRRVADMNNTAWQYIGQAPNVVAMAASGGRLFAATSDNRLIVREANTRNLPWRYIDGASRIVGMTALNGQLYAATAYNALWIRPATEGVAGWSQIGHANGIVGLASANGRIFGATSGGNLWSRDPALSDVPWVREGQAQNIRAMAATRTQLFAAQRAPVDGSPRNNRRYRQTTRAYFAAQPCSSGTTLERRAEFCVDPRGNARIRNGDLGGPVYFRSRNGTGMLYLIGVARQDTRIPRGSAGVPGNYVPTAFVNTPDGLVGTGDIGPWLERMAGVGRGEIAP